MNDCAEPQKKKISLFDKVLNNLAPMHNVQLQNQDDGTIFIIKDDLQFGFIKNKEVYLLIQNDQYDKVKFNYEENPDKLLRAATKSFWLASGKY